MLEGRQGQQFRTSRLAAPHGWHVQGGIRSGGGRARRGGFLIPPPITLTLEDGDVGRPTKATLLGEGCETGQDSHRSEATV
jgi:hypothetical protein